EIYAHIVGAAIPVGAGRFVACNSPRLTDDAYFRHRAKHLGNEATRSVVQVFAQLDKRYSGQLQERFFPELWAAWQAAVRLLVSDSHGWTEEPISCDCLV